VVKGQTEVCPLSRGVIFLQEGNPYSVDYRPTFACSVLLYPQPYRRPLRSAFPRGSATGLPSSAGVTEWGRRSLSTGGVDCPCHGTRHPVNPPQSKASASWPPVWLTVFIENSHVLAIPPTLAPLPVMLGETLGPRGVSAGLMAAGTLSEGNRQVVTALPHLLGYW
jgi:hypothetical protein